MHLYLAVCVGCADTPQEVTGGSGNTWEDREERCVVSSMCHTMHSGYISRETLLLEVKVKRCEESVCSPRYSMYCGSHRPCSLHCTRVELGKKEES